jgi:hypothetical protein
MPFDLYIICLISIVEVACGQPVVQGKLVVG